MSEAREIVGKLSEAQRRVLSALGPLPIMWLPAPSGRATRKKLVTLGLMTEIMPRGGFGMVQFAATPLGLEVRTILEGERS
jgi:hypothetical protein